MAELNIQFGQIPFWAICRFGTRSKIEIVVFSFICAKRFRTKNGESECSRQEIIEHTGLHKSQISTAIQNLIDINWLEVKSKNRWFISETEPEKVHESSTKSSRFVNKSNKEKFTNDEQKVHESSTKSSRIVNSFKKDSDITDYSDYSEREAHTPAREVSDSPSVRVSDNFQNHAFLMNLDLYGIHAHFFASDYCLSQKDKQTIKNRIIDKRAWIETLIYWNENNYQAKSIGKQCDKYDELLIESVKKRKRNGKNQSTYTTASDKRDERAINEFNALQEVRNRVEKRHQGT